MVMFFLETYCVPAGHILFAYLLDIHCWNCQGNASFPRFCLATASDEFEAMDRPVLQLTFIWQAKENTSSRHEAWGMRAGRPKRREEKRSPQLNFGSSFYVFFSPPPRLPCVNWASQESCLFYWRSSLWSSDLPLFYIHGLFPSLSFSHRHSGLLFPILTT